MMKDYKAMWNDLKYLVKGMMIVYLARKKDNMPKYRKNFFASSASTCKRILEKMDGIEEKQNG